MRVIINVKGFAMTPAASLSNPGGRLSKPVALFRLRFFSSVRISSSFTALKRNFSFTCGSVIPLGLLQTRSRSRNEFFFSFMHSFFIMIIIIIIIIIIKKKFY